VITKSIGLTSLMLGSILLAPAQARTDDDPRAELEGAVRLGIKLLEKKEYVAFIQRFMDPESLEELVSKTPLERLAKDELDYRRDRWIAEFKLYLGKTARLEVRERSASFYAIDEKGKEVRLAFTKHGDKWYIK